MSLNPVPSKLKKLGWGAGIFIVLVLAAHFLLPLVVNTSELRLRILSQVSERVGGEVDFKALTLILLPMPHAVVTQGQIERPGMFRIRFAKGVAYLRFWSLLKGRVKISRLTIFEPDIVIPVSTDSPISRMRSQGHTAKEMEQRIRRVLTKVADATGPLAVRIEGGRMTISRPPQTSIMFTEIHFQGRVSDKAMALSVSGRSNLMAAFDIAGHIALGSLDGSARIQLTGLDTPRLVSLGLIPPNAPVTVIGSDLSLGFDTRGLENIHCEYQVKTTQLTISHGPRQLNVRDLQLSGEGRRTPDQLWLSLARFKAAEPEVQLSATASWPAAGRLSWVPAEVTLKGADLDVAPIRNAALKLAGGERIVRHLFDIVRGGRITDLNVGITGIGEEAPGSGANVEIQGRLSRGRIVLPHDLLRLEQVEGRVVMNKGRLTAEDVSARLDNSFAQGGNLVLGLFDGTRDFSLDAAMDADLSELPPVLKKLVSRPQISQLLDRIPPVKGRAAGRLRLGDSLDHINIQVSTTGRMKALDAAMDVSGSIDINPSAGPDCNLSLQGSLGPRMVAWLYTWWGTPTDFMLKAPITVNHARITRNSAEGWGVEGLFAMSGGLKLNAGLMIGPDEDFSCNFHIKDTDSDADLDYRQTQAGGWQAGFAGRLERSTVDKLMIDNAMILGWLRGDLRIRFQDGGPRHTDAQGRLDFRKIYTPPGFPMALCFINGQVAGNGPGVDILSVSLEWQDSVAHLSGRGTFTGDTVNLELDLDVDTLDADELTRRVHFAPRNTDSQPAGRRRPGSLVRGTLRIRAGQMALKGYRIAPLNAVATLGDGYVSVNLIDAGLCGINIPGQIRFDPGGVGMLLKPHADGAALRDTDQCMAGASITERLEGTVSVQGRIESHGQSDQELVHNLKGGLEVQITDGRVYNAGAAGFFTNLLAFISVNQLIDGVMPDLRRNDFHYKNLTSKLSFKDGIMSIEEGVLKSNAVNIVAGGDYGLTDKEMNLVLLISPLTTVDWIIERVPLLGNILQGTLVAVPVGVKGPAADPSVVPLSPKAVGSRLGGILKRTLKTPFRILSPLLKEKPSKDQKDK